MSGVCTVCGTPFNTGDYRCDGTINGERCGKDLLKLDNSSRDSGWWA